MIYPEDKDQFIAAATRAWGYLPIGAEGHVNGESMTVFEARRYYVVDNVTFSIDSVSPDSAETHFGRGQGTHRAYLLYRFMRGESEQLVSALQEIRKIMNGSAGNAAKIRFIDDVVNTALKGRE